MESNFTDRLIKRCRDVKSHVVLELAPLQDKIPAFLSERFESSGAAVYAYNKGIIDAVYDIVPAVILPVHLYEVYGVGGIVAMDAAAKYASAKGMLVIADGGFGGRREALEGYIHAYLGEGGVKNTAAAEGTFFSDAVTLSPYSDAEGIKNAAAYCMSAGKGLFINVRNTVSEDAVHFENIIVKSSDEPLYKSAADDSGAFGRNFIGENGYGVIGMTVYADQMSDELRKLNRWGIVIVRAEGVHDFSDRALYKYFYDDDGEGALILLRDAILYACDTERSMYGPTEYAEAAREAAISVSKKIENMLCSI